MSESPRNTQPKRRELLANLKRARANVNEAKREYLCARELDERAELIRLITALQVGESFEQVGVAFVEWRKFYQKLTLHETFEMDDNLERSKTIVEPEKKDGKTSPSKSARYSGVEI